MKGSPEEISLLLAFFILAIELNLFISTYIFHIFWILKFVLGKKEVHIFLPFTTSLIILMSVVASISIFSILIVFLYKKQRGKKLKKKLEKIQKRAGIGILPILTYTARSILIVLLLSFFMSLWRAAIAMVGLMGLEILIKKWWYSNIINIMMDVSVALIFAVEFGILGAVLLLIVLAIYDYISVFVSKHMLILAKMYEAIPNLAGLFVFTSKRYKKGLFSGMLFLGNGDVAFPNVLISADILSGHIMWGIWVAFASIIGLLVLLLFGKKEKPYPALAFIVPAQLLAQGLLLI